MNPYLLEWLSLIARWFHVFAGILWVGATYYFTWLDGQLRAAEKNAARDGGSSQVWMVHSGGFYTVEKQKHLGVSPEQVHWFRWEAALTWLSGMVLMFIVYYFGGALIDKDVADISLGAGIAIGLGVLVVGWIFYDLCALSFLGKSEFLFAVFSLAMIAAVSYGLVHVMSGRAAYIHVGALFGTIMAANVWMRILPAQRKMIAAAAEGSQFDVALAARAKLRSKHNTFMAVPTVFIMISNHFPVSTYGSRYNWEILVALILAGWGAAKLIRRA
jgi:uncharacterized membrane protein